MAGKSKTRPKYRIKALAAAVYVQMLDPDGNPMLRVAGLNAAGGTVTEPAHRIVFLDRGDALPDAVSDEEIERLKAADAIGDPDDVDGVIRRATVAGAVDEEAQRAAQERLAIQTAPTPAAGVAGMTDEQLIAWIRDEKPTVPELVAAVGDDATLAQRVLDAEGVATGQDPRATLVEQLERVAGGNE